MSAINQRPSAYSSDSQTRRRTFESFHEPHLENQPPMTYMETMMHLLKGNIGTGVFAMPDAMKNSGLFLGPVLTLIIAFISVHSQHSLIKCAKIVTVENKLLVAPSFAETVELSFLSSKSSKWQRMASPMRIVCNIFICLVQLGGCSVYMLFVGKNLQDVLSHHGIYLNIYIWIAIGLIPMWLTAMIRTLKFIALFSATANLFTAVGVTLTIVYLTQQLPAIENRELIADFRKLPFFFGLTLCSYTGITLVLPLKNSMKNPNAFSKPWGVLNIGMAAATVIYLTIGVLGFWRYGNDTMGSVTLNLNPKSIFAQVIKMTVTVSVLLGYAIQLFIPVQIMLVNISDRLKWEFAEDHPIFIELVFRSLVVVVTFLIAIVVPNLTLLLSFVGSVCSTVLSFVLPTMCELILENNRKSGISVFTWVKNSAILSIAVLGISFGGVLSLKQMFANVSAEVE